MGGTELKTDSSYRWVMYTKDAYGSRSNFSTAEQKQAAEEGKQYAQRAYADIWAKDAQLVKRARSFLATHFHWHVRLAKDGADLDVIHTLQSMIRGGSVVLVAAQSRTSSAGPTPAAKAERLPSFRESLMTCHRMSYDAATAYIARYNDMVERINAKSGGLAKDAGFSLTGSMGDPAQTAAGLGNAEAFEHSSQRMLGETQALASTGTRGDMYACDIISAECKASVLREFPGQYLNSTLNDIQSDAQDGAKDARKALKLLNDGRFKK